MPIDIVRVPRPDAEQARAGELRPAAVAQLARLNVGAFKRKLESGAPCVDAAACRHYLGVWAMVLSKAQQSIAAGHARVEGLTPEEQEEVLDAVESGDFDDVVGVGFGPHRAPAVGLVFS
jgi:hypothetical protein